ncbi:ABC transporter ATP-binding protein [Pelagicoccus mobilis]|uniref:ABC transporter ATP-binding protein n=1 Tax=Pelagicoccus mobilis TaxID=415221 RepID=A0A934S0E7_9BACT|nr:ABC transporter ATP-binding protein [Pelagicoccus mobilis]MBK1878699.1 ABC transporter ATP-binding protein [Pelagicoccus mobilis]
MPSVIQTAGLRKTYQLAEPVHALRKVDITIEQGEFVAIMGASGSGKSTLMNIIGCLDRPTEGSYQLDGTEVSGLDRNQRADIRNQKIGFVFQGFNLLARTSALANVELPLVYQRTRRFKNSAKRAAECLERVGLKDRMDHHPSQLSGGQQQRVAIARALVNQPALILADEPTGNLDTKTSLDIMGLFQELNAEGVTILIVTHEPEISHYTKRCIEMRDGLVVADKQIENRRDAREDLANFTSVTSL